LPILTLALFFQITFYKTCHQACHSALDAESKTLTSMDSCFHRNDKTMMLSAELRTRNDKIGFDWVCFFVPQGLDIAIIPFLIRP